MLLKFCYQLNILRHLFSHKVLSTLTTVLLFVTALSSAQAQQNSFNVQKNNQNTSFSYQWQHNNQSFKLKFDISSASLYAMPASPAAYSQAILQEHVYRNVMLEAKKVDPMLANISIIKQNNGLSFNVKSKQESQAQLILNQLEKAYREAQLSYWTNNLFIEYKTASGEAGIRHDHAKYTAMSSDNLQPIVEAIKQMQQQVNNPREFIQIALSWVQSIPYNSLENRLSSNAAGFLSPRDLILQNQGDCDSKSTLLAALLKVYKPRIGIQMVYLPNHALLGLAMRPLANEITVTNKGIEYVLLEPTGPAQFVIGELAQTTQLALSNSQFDMISL